MTIRGRDSTLAAAYKGTVENIVKEVSGQHLIFYDKLRSLHEGDSTNLIFN